jgi:hypothetical protein
MKCNSEAGQIFPDVCDAGHLNSNQEMSLGILLFNTVTMAPTSNCLIH